MNEENTNIAAHTLALHYFGLQKCNLRTLRGHSHNTYKIYDLAGYKNVTHEQCVLPLAANSLTPLHCGLQKSNPKGGGA